MPSLSSGASHADDGSGELPLAVMPPNDRISEGAIPPFADSDVDRSLLDDKSKTADAAPEPYRTQTMPSISIALPQQFDSLRAFCVRCIILSIKFIC